VHWIANFADSSYHQKLSALAKSGGSSLLHRWRFSDENIVEWLNRASVMVYSARLEPFGLAPLEANARATPVVAVAEGGVRESIRNGVHGVLIPERRPEQIGQELLSFLETSSCARDISLASRQGLARDPSRGQVG
jgi:glycosyltransferase involved in cell wall biosynthesis